MKRSLLLFASLACVGLRAEDITPALTVEAIVATFTDGKPLPALETKQRVLTQFTVSKGKDMLIYRRVSAPTALRVASQSNFVTAPMAPSPEALAREEAYLSRLTYLCPSVVVYPQGVTEIKWWNEDGTTSKRVFAHAALEFLPHSLTIDLSEWAYGFSFFHWGNGLFGDDVKIHQLPADIRTGVVKALALPVGQYVQVTAENGKFSPLTEREAEALDAVLVYYALNQSKLAGEHAEAVAHARIWDEAKRVHEATAKTYEIRIWKNQ